MNDEKQTAGALGSTEGLGPLVEAAGMVNVLNHGSGSCVYSEGCHGVTQEHLERFAELVRADERRQHLDCRTCRHYAPFRGCCDSVLQCIGGNGHDYSHHLRLWPADTQGPNAGAKRAPA